MVCSVAGGISANIRPEVCSEHNYCAEVIEVCRRIGGVLLFRDIGLISGFRSAVLWNVWHSMFENNSGWHSSGVLSAHVTFERISSRHSSASASGTSCRR